MGAIEDTRQLIQDSLLPEFRESKAQMQAFRSQVARDMPEMKKELLEAIRLQGDILNAKMETLMANERARQSEEKQCGSIRNWSSISGHSSR